MRRSVGWRGKLRRLFKKNENTFYTVSQLSAVARVSDDDVKAFALIERNGKSLGKLGRDLIPDRFRSSICGYIYKPAGENAVYAEAESDYEFQRGARAGSARKEIKDAYRANTGHELTTSLNIKALLENCD